MQQQILKLSFSLALGLIVRLACSQNVDEQDSSKVAERKSDSLKVKFYPRTIRVGTDLISIIKTYTVNTFAGWEVNGDVDCGKIYLAADVGSWGRTYDLPNYGRYENQGTYWRAGGDINLLKKDPDKNMFFVGLRYGHSSFTESSTIVLTDPVFGYQQKQFNNNAVTAGWGELTAGLRVRIWKEFWMGYTARLKFAPSVKGDNEIKAYDIPGYGLNEKKFYWGFNYQIFWRIPFTKQKKVTAPFPK